MRIQGKKDPSKQAWRGFWQLGVVNAGAALLGFALLPHAAWIVVTFPVLHLLWSLPWTVVSHTRGHHDYASGLEVALGLSSLAGCACWGLVLFNLDIPGG